MNKMSLNGFFVWCCKTLAECETTDEERETITEFLIEVFDKPKDRITSEVEFWQNEIYNKNGKDDNARNRY